MCPLRILPIAAMLLCSVVLGQKDAPFKHPVLDELLGQMSGIGTDDNLELIDGHLRAAGPNAELRLVYFLRRYRCEQLYYQGLFDESMVEAERARRIALDIGDSLYIASSLNQVAVLLEERNAIPEAIRMLKDALRLYPTDASSSYPITQLHRIYGNLGLCWSDLGMLDSARIVQERSYELAEQDGVARGQALALIKIGELDMRKGLLDGALTLFERGIATAAKNNITDVVLDGMGAKAEALARLGRIIEMRGTLREAETYIAERPDIAQKSLVNHRNKVFRLLAGAGSHKAALEAAQVWREMDRALRSSKANMAQRTLARIHATDIELDKELARMELAEAAVEAEQRIQRILLIGGTVSLLLLSALVIGFIARGRNMERLTRLELQRLELERKITDLRVRQQVASDLHDDLGAGLSALKLNCELAELLGSDTMARNRYVSLSRIAGDLIAGMRHILWSLNNTNASAGDIAAYVADRAHAYCTEYDRSLILNKDATWPDLIPDAEVRQLLWILVKETLHSMMLSGASETLELTLCWKEGLRCVVTRKGASDRPTRALLASALSSHHFRVSGACGTLRTSTDGPLSVEIVLPVRNSNAGEKSTSIAPLIAILTALALVLSTTCGAQERTLYRNVVLDELFTPEALRSTPTTRLAAINEALGAVHGKDDAVLECHLRLSRANQMYYGGFYDQGISDVNRCLELAQALNDSLLIATTYNMIGLLNENLGNDRTTLHWFELADQWIPKDTRSNYPVVQSYHILGNMANCLERSGRLDSAAVLYDRSRSQADAVGAIRALALANLGAARISLMVQDHQLTFTLLDSCMAQARRDGSYDVVLDAYPVLAEARALRNGPTHGISTLDEADPILRYEIGMTPSSRRNFLERSSELRERFGQYDRAVSTWIDWQRLDSTINVADDRASMATLKLMLDNDQRLYKERAGREERQARLELDRAQGKAMVAALGSTALLLGGITLLYAGRRRNKVRMATLEKERTKGRKELAELRSRQRLSEEMHEALGTGLTALSLRSTSALDVESDSGARERIERIITQSTELIESLRQIIWALDAGQGGVAETVQYTTRYARTYCAQQGLMVSVHADTNWPVLELTMEQRRNILLIVKEALHNVVKHAGASHVELRLAWCKGLQVEIRDNGRGIATFTSTMPSGEGNGLRNMRSRVRSMGGSFDVIHGAGTTLRFTVPLEVPAITKSARKHAQA